MSSSERISQENIYKDVIEKIEVLLSETSTEELSDERITVLYQGAKNQLSSIKEALSKELHSLQEHAEWNSFTIAFYGETNMGKSTLIEALRILLHEETKVKDRVIYSDAYKKLIDLQDKYSKVENEINRLQEEKVAWTQEINASIDKVTRELEEIDNRQKYDVALIEANKSARAELRSTSMEDFFAVLFGKDEYSIKNDTLREEIPKLRQEYEERQSRLNRDKDMLRAECEKFNQGIKPLEAEKAVLEQDISPLESVVESHRDGQIIGTGRSDFTQEVTEYSFIINDQNVTLLDLPGIEGQESQYVDLIVSALEKAHAVFYISKYPRPPQNGEDKTSTISKVVDQLSGQTEVFFIYNKPGNNPAQIENNASISNDVQKSLREVDEILGAELGEKYKGHIVVSAMPAYLANSNNYGHDEKTNKFRKRQEKLLSQFTPEELICNSNIDVIIKWLEDNLSSKYKRNKIKDANYHKILNCLVKTEREIETLENKFKDLRETISGELTACFKEIDARLNSMIYELRDAKRTASHQFVFKSNEIIDEEIDKGVEDEELNEIIKDVFEAQSRDAIDLFNKKVKELGEEYAKDVADINNKYQKYFSENITVFSDASELGFEYDPIIGKHKKKNDDTAWIIGEIIGTLLFISTANTVVLVATIIGLLIRVGRYIVKTIDPESNKAFQRQDLDQNVKNAATELERTLQEHNEIVVKRIEDNNQKIKDRMEISLKDLDNTLMALEREKNGINLLHMQYINEGEAAS